MKITFTYAKQKHLKWLKEQERHIILSALKNKIVNKQIILVQSKNEIIGWLRFGLFWDSIPFINMLFIKEGNRNKGIGKKLVQFWELEMKKKKYKLVMTSSQSNEEGQYFYRKFGYADAGFLTIPSQKSLEIIFIKKL